MSKKRSRAFFRSRFGKVLHRTGEGGISFARASDYRRLRGQAHRFSISTLDSTLMCGSSNDIMALSETSDALKNFEASAINWLSMTFTQQTE